jgi:hypothetical protein
MKKLVFIVMAIFGLTFAMQNNAFAQPKKTTKRVQVYGTQGAGSGADLSVPSGDEVREKKSKSRGYCYLYMDNYTGYYIDIWVEGQYQGRLSPYATSVRFDVWTPGNYTRWYARTAGGTYSWSNDSYCNDSRVFTINLR